jgi:cytochrome c
MTFAGLSNPQDRANVMAFLNSRDASPLPLPAAPAATAATDADASKPGTGPEQPGPQKAENEPADAKKPGGGEAMNQPAPAH